MIPIAKGSYICNLGQIGQHVTKLSIKACEEDDEIERGS